ncbi:hypothetical protein C0989_001949, partial [Termitomyces sp. Mn162]
MVVCTCCLFRYYGSIADLEDELRQANEELYKLEEWCANLEEDNRALAGIRPPPD